MSFKTVLFGKVDLDTIATAFVMGVDPISQAFRAIAGSASGEQLSDPSTLCIEVGGSGRVEANNFDHHEPGMTALSACAQSLERLARIVRYVDDIDRGELEKTQECEFPSLLALISGMLLCERRPEEQMKQGLVILREVMHSGVDPYGSMRPILKSIPGAEEWAARKRAHERLGEQVCKKAQWLVTRQNRLLAVVETDWFGAPGALYGQGAEVVIALNPKHERAGKVYRKFTVAGKDGFSVIPALQKLQELEEGWGGPQHGTICGSPEGHDSELSSEVVTRIVIENL